VLPLRAGGFDARCPSTAKEEAVSRVLDDLELRIATALQVDPRASWRRIAAVLGEPERTVARRGNDLIESRLVNIVGIRLRPPSRHMHFTPTYSSWLNQVERFFGFVTEDLLRRGDPRSVQALEADIRTWISEWNTNPHPSPDKDRRTNPRIPRATSEPNFRRRTLAMRVSWLWSGAGPRWRSILRHNGERMLLLRCTAGRR
jgi:DNA-binding Lrp family transcriptional regulator